MQCSQGHRFDQFDTILKGYVYHAPVLFKTPCGSIIVWSPTELVLAPRCPLYGRYHATSRISPDLPISSDI